MERCLKENEPHIQINNDKSTTQKCILVSTVYLIDSQINETLIWTH
jgi:hypothetical protein